MALTITLYLQQQAFAPGEPARPVLILANTGAEPLLAPALDGAGHESIQLTLQDPSGVSRSFALPDDSGNAPRGGGNYADLEAGQDVMRICSLGAAAQPGTYELKAVLQPGGAAVISNTLRWYQEAPGPISVVAPAYRGVSTPARQQCFYFFRGDLLNALYACDMRFDDCNVGKTLVASEPQRLLDVDASARNLCAITGITASPGPGEEWLAWLAGDGLHAAVDVLGMQQVACALPFEAGNIAGQIAGLDGKTFDVLVTDKRNESVTMVRFGRPVPLPVPQAAEADSDAESASPADEEPLDEEDDDDDPLFPVEVPAPQLVWTYQFEKAIAGAAFAAGINEHAGRRALAAAVQHANGVEILYAGFDAGAAPERFTSILVAHGELLEGCAPAMAIDLEGCAHIAVLVKTVTPHGEIQVVVARTSFTADGVPRLDAETVYHGAAVIPCEPLRGVVSFFIDDHGGPWFIDWCVILDDNRYLISSRISSTEIKTPPAAMCHPLRLLSFAERCYIAAFAAGQPAFIDCV
jgi:hypothetical protein